MLSRRALLCAHSTDKSFRRLAPAAHSTLAGAPPSATSSRFCLCFRFIDRFVCVLFQSPRITDTLWHFFSFWLRWKLLSARPPRPVCCVCRPWFTVLSTPLVPFPQPPFLVPRLSPDVVRHRLCPRPALSPPLSHLLLWPEPQARPSDGRACSHPKPGPACSLYPQAGGPSSAVVAAVLPGSPAGPGGVLGEATSSLSLQRHVNAKTCRFILSSLWKRLLSAIATTWVRASTVLSCGRLPAGLSASMLRLHPSPKAAARVMFLECN